MRAEDPSANPQADVSRQSAAPPVGVLLVDKPGGRTSHDVVGFCRKRLGTRKIGHAGTLDPMATGLLVLGVGSGTRLLTYLVGEDKDYSATIRLGVSTSTEDAEGEVTGIADPKVLAGIGDEAIRDAMRDLTGEIQQIPSAVSAIKVDGVRSYQRVRAGEDVVLKARPVTVHAFELGAVRRALEATPHPFIDLDVRVSCSSGTYVRALARDLGQALGCGAHLTVLRRTRVGPFAVDDAAPLDDSITTDCLIPLETAASDRFDAIQLDERDATALGHGQRIRIDHADTEEPVAAIAPNGRLIGLMQIRSGAAKSIVNFPAASDGEVANG